MGRSRKSRAAAETYFYQGVHHMSVGDDARAEVCFGEALELVPDFAEASANLGLLLDRRGVADAAEMHYRRALELGAAYPEVHLNLGGLLVKQRRFGEAETAYRQVIALAPQLPSGWSSLGMLCACMQREAEAEHCYRTAIALDDSHAPARFNFSYLLLRQGRFEEGWQYLEARNGFASLSAYLACPRWQGEVLAGKSILIGYESGHGDMIQFCRYAAVLKARGTATIAMLCHPGLKTLFAEVEHLDEVIGFDEPIAPSGWDYWTPPLSIPHHCGTRLDNIPADLPYLRASAGRVAQWAPRLPAGRRVGLVWKGNPRHENDADRSLPSLDLFAPLWQAAPDINFISLQKGAGEDEAEHPPAGLPLLDLGSQFADFADAAAVVANLDLVICVDTAIAHLAGALGKPCWLLLPDYKTDWRWLTGRTDSPWYPGVMRLFRQREMGDWGGTIAEVAAALRLWARGA